MSANRARIDVVVPSLDHGDGVTYDGLRCRDALRALGFASDLYGDLSASAAETRSWAHDINQLGKREPSDAVLYEYSTESRCTEVILSKNIPFILRYQNITPAHFFDSFAPDEANRLRSARAQLTQLAPVAIGAICPSQFNAKELRTLGCTQVHVVPNFCRLRTPTATVVSLTSRPLRILFIGRLVPNKCQHELIRVATFLAETFGQATELILAGSDTACPPYASLVRSLASQSKACVRVVGKFPEQTDIFAEAPLYLSLSEHEGFGMPLVEAMSAGLAVIAYAAAAVPEVVGQGGLLFDTKTPEGIAGLIQWIVENPSNWAQLHHAALVRAQDFTHEKIRRQLGNALRQLGFVVNEHETLA